jgi:hypothetical protein
MIRMNPLKLGAAMAVVLAASALPAYAQAGGAASADEDRDRNLTAYTELLRTDIRAQKVAVITGVMELTEDQDKKFWPIYRQYETDLAKINDDRIALVKNYVGQYDQLTDETADKIARGALDLELRRHNLTSTYYDRFKSALGAKTAARFLQVEHQILLLLDLQIAASLPIASR